MVVGDTESTIAGKSLAIFDWYDTGRIARWNTSRASLEANGCRHRASACIALPRWPPWSTMSVENTKH